METITSGAVYERLQVAGVLPTLQRLAIGAVHDLHDGQLKVSGMPALRDDLEMAEVDAIVRVRRRKTVG